MKTVTYPSPNIKCEGCADTIKGTLSQLPGVNSVQVDVSTKRVNVDYDEEATTSEVIQQSMAEVGFPSPGPERA